MFVVVIILLFGSGIMFFGGFALGEWVYAVECGGVGFWCKGFVFLIDCFVLAVVLCMGEMHSQSFQSPLGFLDVIVDDGITGMKLDRKEFTRMLEDIEKGLVGCVLIKDLSRLSRDKSQANDLVEKFFPLHDVRLICVSEGTDSDEGEDEFLGFRTLMNEMYARDISKKRKLTNQVKGNEGVPLSPPPYGYMLDPDNPKRWVLDPVASEVVKRIFDMTLSGKGTEQIAAALSEDMILTPIHYWKSKGINRSGRIVDREPHKWNSSTVVKMLTMQEYCGDVINFKTYSKNFKLKKRFPTAEENKAIFKGVHEAIVDRTAWERIQEKRGKVRKRKTLDGDKNMFSGLLVCADCGKNLWFHFNQGNHDIKYFNCSNYKGNRGTCLSTHYIRVDFLEQVILQEIRRLTKFASKHEGEFAKLVMGHSKQADTSQRERKQKELYALRGRDKELKLTSSLPSACEVTATMTTILTR